MKHIALLILAVAPLFVSAQDKTDKKDKKDKNTFSYVQDGNVLFTVNREDCGFNSADCHFDVLDKDNNRVIRITPSDFKAKSEVSASNPDGTVRYFQYAFLGTEQIAESKATYIKPEKLADYIFKQHLFPEGVLDTKAVDEFILINGMKFSERAKAEMWK